MQTDDPVARARCLAPHPEAEGYADFADFAFYRMQVKSGHYVTGFGKIHDLSPSDLLISTEEALLLIEAEPQIVAHMNEDHADAIELYATQLLRASPGPWRIISCDPEGCDLMLGKQALRLDFPERVTNPDEARKWLVALVQKARNGGAPGERSVLAKCNGVSAIRIGTSPIGWQVAKLVFFALGFEPQEIIRA